MLALLAPLFVIATLLLPTTPLLVVAIPTMMVLSGYMNIIAPVVDFGDKPIHLHDLVILTLIFRLFARYCMTRFRLELQPVHRFVGLYLMILFGTTLIAYFRIGPVFFSSELSAFFRFVMLVGIFFLLSCTLTNSKQLAEADRYFQLVGLAISCSVILCVVLYLSTGYKFGEVQDAQELIRYFGPLGDQVGFIIALFCFREVLAGRNLSASLHGAAIFVTGTRGAILTLLVGILVAFVSRQRSVSRKPLQGNKVSTLLAIIVVIALAAGFGAMLLTRFTDTEHLSSGLTQRGLSMMLGMKVFLNNALTGVGYSGFRFAAIEYDPESLFPAFTPNVITNTSNQLIQVATDAGIVGVIGFLLLMKSCYTTLKDGAEQSPEGLRETMTAGRIWLIALLIGNQTAVWLIQGSMVAYIFWTLIAMAAVAAQLSLPGQGSEKVT